MNRLFSASLLGLASILLANFPAQAFTVIKNVNTGSPPVEKLVIFDKARGAANHVTFVVDNATAAVNADGAIQIDFLGNKKLDAEIHWKADGPLGETFDATKYNFLMLTCHFEGVTHKTDPFSNKVSDMPAGGNMWMAAVLRDKNDLPVGYVNLADAAEDGKTPITTTVLAIPMSLYSKGSPNDAHHVAGIAFPWGETHPELSRDLHLIIDKIALAE